MRRSKHGTATPDPAPPTVGGATYRYRSGERLIGGMVRAFASAASFPSRYAAVGALNQVATASSDVIARDDEFGGVPPSVVGERGRAASASPNRWR